MGTSLKNGVAPSPLLPPDVFAPSPGDVARIVEYCQRWVDANAEHVSGCYLLQSADGFEAYPVAVGRLLDSPVFERFAELVCQLVDTGLPTDGLPQASEPTAVTARFDFARARRIAPRAVAAHAV